MKFLTCLLALQLATALAGPVREKRTTKDPNEILKRIKILKDPATYSDLNDISEMFKSVTHIGKSLDLGELTPEEQKEMKESLKFIGRVEEGAKVLYHLAKATLVEGAKPTEQQLTDLAKRLSAVVRQSRLSVRNYADADTLMTNETINVLKQIAEENVVKENGNAFLDMFKEKLPTIYPAASTVKKIHDGIKIGMKTGNMINLKNIPQAEKEAMGKFFGEFMADETISMLKSEPTAIEMFKNFGVLTDTLKTASSYDSLKAMFTSLSRSKRFEAHGILIRETGKCLGKALSDEEKAEFHEHIGKLMQLAKLFLADGQDTSNIEEAHKEFKQKSGPVLAKVAMKLTLAVKTPQGKKRFSECLVTEEDRKLYKETMALPDAVLSETQISEVRGKNEKIYAFVYLLNGIVKSVRSREGLGAEADSFFKEMVTMPNSMLRFAEFFASQDTLDKIAANKKAVLEKYNGLSGAAKKEFVDMYPYRTVINLALLD